MLRAGGSRVRPRYILWRLGPVHSSPAHQRRLSAPEPTGVEMTSNSFFAASLAQSDPEIARSIELELGRQRDEIELIASENIVSRAVL